MKGITIKTVACFVTALICLGNSWLSSGDQRVMWFCTALVMIVISWVLDEMAGWRRM